MGQKVNPHGIRVGVIKNWDSRWFAKDDAFGDILVEDYNLRKFLKNSLQLAGVPRIEIERDATKVRIHIHCAKPGMVIGKGGAEIEKLRTQCEKIINKDREVPVKVSAGKTYLLPPRNETVHRPYHEAGCSGYQGSGFRSSGRRRDR